MSENKLIEQEVEKKFNQLLERIPDILKSENKKDETDFFNFSIIELYQNTMQTIIDIINDVMRILDNYNKDSYFMTLVQVFFHEKRMFYIGIILIILSFVIYFIDGATI
jgi:hypothetical protein